MLLFGGLFVAALLVCLVPVSEEFRSASLSCGTPLRGAFRSSADYRRDYLQTQVSDGVAHVPGTQGYTSIIPPPRGFDRAARQCVADSQTRLWIGGPAALVAIAAPIGMAGLRGRRRARAT